MLQDSVYSGDEEDFEYQPDDVQEHVSKKARLEEPEADDMDLGFDEPLVENNLKQVLDIVNEPATSSKPSTEPVAAIQTKPESMETDDIIPGLFLQPGQMALLEPESTAQPAATTPREAHNTTGHLKTQVTRLSPSNNDAIVVERSELNEGNTVVMNEKQQQSQQLEGNGDDNNIETSTSAQCGAFEDVQDLNVVAALVGTDDAQSSDQLSEEYIEFLRQAEQNKGDPNAEFELDSDPEDPDAASSSDSDPSSDDSSSDEDDSDSDDAEADQVFEDIREEARRMMAEDAMSDEDEGGPSKSGGGSGDTGEILRTKNEVAEEAVTIKKPELIITEDMEIVALGVVESVVGLMGLIKASVSGEYQVLNESSVLCFENRSLLGTVQDTLGRVEQPLYTVRFSTTEEVTESGVEVGKKVFYVPSHSTFAFTNALKAIKGSDASNIYDEEVGEDEMEWSDDEAEAEYKRRKKEARKPKQQQQQHNNGNSRGVTRSAPNIRTKEGPSKPEQAMNYDEAPASDEPYTPLARPTNLHEMLNAPPPNMVVQGQQRGGFRGRGRGNDQGGRGGRFDGGRGRGNDRGGRGGRGRGNFEPRGRGSNSFSPRDSINDSEPRNLPQQPKDDTSRRFSESFSKPPSQWEQGQTERSQSSQQQQQWQQWQRPHQSPTQSQQAQYSHGYQGYSQAQQPTYPAQSQWSPTQNQNPASPSWPAPSFGYGNLPPAPPLPQLPHFNPQLNTHQSQYQSGHQGAPIPPAPYYGSTQGNYGSVPQSPTVPILLQGAHINPAFFTQQAAASAGQYSGTQSYNSGSQGQASPAQPRGAAGTPNVQDILHALQMNTSP